MNKTTHQISEQVRAACPLCASQTSTILAAQLRRGDGVVSYCDTCDHGYLVHVPAIDPKEYYGEQYRQEYAHTAEPAATNAQEIFNVYKNFQRDRLRHVSTYLHRNTQLLEIGASAGQFLTHIREKVLDVNAIELDKACHAFLVNELGIEADAEYLESSRFADKTYDVVCAFQVLEHVENPVKFLRAMRKALKNGGVGFIEVPNLRDPLLSVWDVPEYRKFYYHSAHLHYFSETSLSKVAREAGFNPNQIEISYTQDYNLLNHLHWIMNNGPQSDCFIGLNEVRLDGADEAISKWLTEEMIALNSRYISRLIERKQTSNMIMKLANN
jgi:2-polyprenyl-3-methyl-5-hydroxy-6-metoxy-1,4-benzoquinol methylase